MSDKSIFAKRLTQKRIELKYTQETFSAKVGMSRARYANYEQSRREPDFDVVKLFAENLDCTTDYLLGHTDNPNKPVLSELEAGAASGLQRKIAGKLPYLSEKNLKLIEQMIDALPDEK